MNSIWSLSARAASLLPACLVALLSRDAAAACPPGTTPYIQVGSQRFQVEQAVTDKARERGLSGRPALAAGRGMWFEMPGPGYHGFWMKDMAFPIDLVWVAPDLIVLGARRLEPCAGQGCPVVHPPAPAAYVLEVNAGAFQGKPGDPVLGFCLP